MQVHWAYFGCTKDDEEHLDRCWQARQDRLRPRLDALEAGAAALQWVASRQEGSPQWHVQTALHVPGATIVVEAGHDDAGEAMDAVIAQLLDRMDRLEERPEKVTVRREGLHGIVPLLERCCREGRSGVFFAWLAPLIGTLAAHVRRELRMRERDQRLAVGEIDPSDVLDDVLLQAYERFASRPAQLPLDLWLLQLADDALDRACESMAESSLDQPVEQPSEEPQESERDSWIEWASSTETIALGDLLPGVPGAEQWDSLDMERKHAETESMLSRLPRIQRQALVLNTVYGYAPAEIADFQDRPESEVLFELNDARRVLETYFREEYLPEIEEKLKAR